MIEHSETVVKCPEPREESREQILKDPIDYWSDLIQEDLHAFKDFDRVKQQMKQLRDNGFLNYYCIDNTGVMAYMITPDFRGGLSCVEIMFYIRPEHRGNLRLVKRYILRLERIAMDNSCNCVKIGANIEYKDESLIKLLKRWGYVDDTVSKYLR